MKLIDADALWMEFIHRMDYCDDILEIVEEMPEAVVRCENCRWHYYRENDIVCANRGEVMQTDDYCSYGERRSE